MPAARIAIVDDDPMFGEYLSAFLKSRGYDTSVLSSGAEVLKALATTSPPDLVLLDVLMPSMNGLETLRELHAAHPQLPVIMVSGQQVPATIIDAVRLGAVDYVLKADGAPGLHEAALEAAVNRAVERINLTTEVERLSAQMPESPDGMQACWNPGSAMREVVAMVDRVADNDVSVLLTGESGVGKEVLARELHRRSSRRGRPFVKVNCAALPSELLESELFGHERGAFTGAQASRIGKFEFADGGTLMLDEICEMPVGLQAKLLHVLQDGEITKLGSNRTVPTDVRVLAATNRDIATEIRAGTFREDLYYRLQVIEIRVPPLRDRRDEIPALLDFFLRKYADRFGRPVVSPSAVLRDAFKTHSWPGNIRELENAAKRLVILRDEARVLADLRRNQRADGTEARPEPPATARSAAAPPVLADAVPVVNGLSGAPLGNGAARTNGAASKKTVRLPELARAAAMAAERQAIQSALDQFRWNRRKAAQLLGVSYKTLLNKIRECGIAAPADLDDEPESLADVQ